MHERRMKTVFAASVQFLLLSLAGILAAFVIPVMVFMDSLYYETNRRNLEQAADLLAPLFLERLSSRAGEEAEAPLWLQTLVSGGAFRYTLILPGGKVAEDSRAAPGALENHAERPEVKEALAGRRGSARRRSASLGLEQLYSALPLYAEDGALLGALRVSLDVPGFWQRIRSSAAPFLFIALLISAAACCAAYLFSRSLSRSFNRLAETADTGASVPSSRLMSDTKEFVMVETALRNMAAELRSSLEEAKAEGRRREAILNGMSEAIFAVDSGLRLTLVNPRACSLFDIHPAAAGISLLEATRSAKLEEAAKQVLAGTSPVEFELDRHTGGGQTLFQVFAAPLGDEGAIIVLNDITRLHRLEQVRKDFAANVSHELRTPIQLIKGFSETLLDCLRRVHPPVYPETNTLQQQHAPPACGGDVDCLQRDSKAAGNGTVPLEQIIHGLEIISKNALTMENLTNDLLNLVRLEDTQNPLPEKIETRAAELIREAVQSVELERVKKNITIHESCPADLRAKLYGPLIIQALINLLDNAIKYSPASSSVWIGAELSEDSGGPAELAFTVRDEGMGIPPEHIGRIFERFYRVDKARSREAGGTGLGLAIVRHIALIHDGKAEAESHAGEGSLFRLILTG